VKNSLVVIDSDVRILNYIHTILAEKHPAITTWDSGKRAIEHIRKGPQPAVVLIANDLPDVDYLDLIQQIRRLNPHIRIVVMSRMDRYGDLAAAIGAGARQVLLKPFLPDDVIEVLPYLTSASGADADAEAVEFRVTDDISFVYASACMHTIQQHAALVARVQLPVLLLGESGTGKEVVARFIHSLSRQANNTFLKVNCAAVPSELLESELFGYKRGAFTGADHDKPGKFKLCNNGTMFLDEIGEMHPSLQSKLLQVLQDGTYSPLGSHATEKVDVRIIAATNIDLKAAIANRMFREDLYYRLNGFCFTLPPLRERREDIPVLIRHFLRRHSPQLSLSSAEPSMSSRLITACVRYGWPGNLRELESFVKRYLVLGDEQLMIDELTREIADRDSEAEITAEAILGALRLTGGNRRAAAKRLNISYKVLLQTMRELGMEAAAQPAWVT